MATTDDVGDATKKTVTNVKTYVEQQIEQQVTALADRVGGTGSTLRSVASTLRLDPNIGFLAPPVDGAASYVDRFTGYLNGRGVDRMLSDFGSFSREQPFVATVVAVVAGFTISRGIKASLGGGPSTDYTYSTNGK